MPAIRTNTILTAGYLLKGNRYVFRGSTCSKSVQNTIPYKKRFLFLNRHQAIDSISFRSKVNVAIRALLNGADAGSAFH